MGESSYNGSQIRDGVILNRHIGASAGIVTSKLADAAIFIFANGVTAFTQDQSMGGNKLTNLATGVSGTDAVNVTQLTDAITNAAVPYKFKNPARLAATGNVNIASPGTSTFDGVTANNNDRIFLGNQSTASQKGMYVFNGSGSPMTRATDFDTWAEIPAAFFAVEEGTTLHDTLWLNTNDDGGTLNTTAITFIQLPTSAGYTTANFVDGEVMGGTIDGSNDTFTLAVSPTAGSQHIYYNGQRLRSGAGNDYTISGATITWIRATMPISGDVITADYRK